MIQQVLELITTNPGNMVYHFVLAFSIFGALQGSLNAWRDDNFPQSRRMVIGLGLLLGTRLALFLATIPVYLGLLDAHLFLPVADRVAMAFGLILIIWLWVFPEPLRTADAATRLLELLVFVIFILNQVWWVNQVPGSAFNAQFISKGWEVLALIILIFGTILILRRRPNGWGYGFSMMVLLNLGHLFQLIAPDVNSDYPGAVRLFEMAGFALLFAIPNRFEIPVPKPLVEVEKPVRKEEPRQYGIEPETFQTILSLSEKATREATCLKLTKLLGESLLADISLIILPPDQNNMVSVQCGYDLITETYLDPIVLAEDQIPMVVSAMRRSRPLRLPASSTSIDLASFGHYLDLGRTGHLLAAFVPSLNRDDPVFGVVLLSPYSERRWTRDDQAYLNKITAALAPILQQADRLDKLQKELEITKQNLLAFQKLLEETQNENAGLRSELTEISERIIQTQEAETVRIQEKQHETQALIDHLQTENRRLREMSKNLIDGGEGSYSDSAQLEGELKLALTEISQLNIQLSDAERQLKELKESASRPEKLTEDQIEVFTSISQDLRQPMSSIIGYTDLLLGESVGILGALQRKFLERIKVSTERMGTLLDDIFQIVTLDGEGLTLSPESVDLGSVIDEAIADTRNQLQKRGIVLRVDFPEEMPKLIADRDALEQVLIQLLKNAGTATPVNGEIFLRASIYQTEDTQEYVLMQVADQGGGIPKEDLPRVFSRLYRADNPLIQGIGDTGVGLSIVKALVEAHNGRIWVDTELGKGSTFSLLIPLSNGSMASNGTSNTEVGTP